MNGPMFTPSSSAYGGGGVNEMDEQAKNAAKSVCPYCLPLPRPNPSITLHLQLPMV